MAKKAEKKDVEVIEEKTKKDKIKDEAKKSTSRKTTKSASSSSKASTRSKSTVAKKKQTKKTSSKNQEAENSKKTVATKKKTTPRTKVKKEPDESTAKSMLAEYYDLPYRYNQTIVKVLAQTPTTLFVYWDISDEDRNSLINAHGQNFFYETRPILIVHNLTHNYSFEIEINDFANSWYIRTQEPNCDYVIELGRKYNQNQDSYIYIDSSNKMVSPNDHILFERTNLGNVLFRNVKTNKLSHKDFGSLRFINDIDKLYGNIYDVYSALYNEEDLNKLSNPSSGEFISSGEFNLRSRKRNN